MKGMRPYFGVCPYSRIYGIFICFMPSTNFVLRDIMFDVSVATPPSSRRPVPRPLPDSPDKTLTQAAHILAKKSRSKKAPLPPKRTSSFKDNQVHGSVSPSIPPLPETLLEMEGYYSAEHTPEELDAMDSVEKEFQFLNDNNKVMSSSDEKLSSTPASQSRSGSLDRVPERGGIFISSGSPRSRSSSRERSLDDLNESSPGKSSELKTPDTDFSDNSAPLPPPPPEVVFPPPPPPEDLQLELEPIHTVPTSLPKQSIRQQVFPKGPVPMLRASLRKTQGPRVITKKDLEDGVQSETGDKSNKTIGSLEESNVKQVISQYGTIPKGARIGAFLASLEQNSQGSRKEVVAQLKSPSNEQKSPIDKEGNQNVQPTPEVTRKVEEWRRKVEDSMNQDQNSDGPEHNVRPSSICRSPSLHAIPGSEEQDSSGLNASIKRNKSNLNKANSLDKSKRNSHNTQLLQNLGIKENMDAPIPEWKRQAGKPTPSPRVQPRNARGQSKMESVEPNHHSKFPGVKDIVKSPSHRQEIENKTFDNKNVNTDSIGEYPVHEGLMRKFSPPVPKKPTPASTPPGKVASGRTEDPMTKSTDSSLEGSIDAVIDSKPIGIMNRSLWEKDTKSDKDKDKVNKKDKKDSLDRKKQLSPSPSDKEKTKSKFSFLKHGGGDSGSKTPKDSPVREPVKAPGKHLPPGAQPVLPGVQLPGARQVLPGSMPKLQKTGGQGSPINTASHGPPGGSPGGMKMTPQSVSAVHLHKVEKQEKSDKNGEDAEPISKEKLKTLSKNLSSSLASLNSNKTKHTSNFMHLSVQVQSFYTACSSYVESLPPHGKFQFRELLINLQDIAESLKTCSGGNAKEYDKLLSRLQNSIRDINGVLAR